MSDPSLPEVACAIVRVGGRYALQLRDEFPEIAWPGHWGLFGGEMEPGESAAAGIARELDEELGVRPLCRWLWTFDDHRDAWGRRRTLHAFEADASDVWATHRLTEGQAAVLFEFHALPAKMVPTARRLVERYHAEVSARGTTGKPL